ncbi:hypothetical protein [Larkinella soli]|uniref:hypothetical protein n=1 Tax=Larkinella soli TaxID=1770527 RepID=UPI000FFB0D3D|nr:hypothetical protein [Larkinella soli]
MKLRNLIELLRTADTPEEITAVSQAVKKFVQDASPEEVALVKRAQSEMLDRIIAESDMVIEEGKRYLALNGKQYKLEDWLTSAEYARKYGLSSANVVTNWIMRGVIPPEDIIDVPELNNLKLVRNREYKKTSTEVGD